VAQPSAALVGSSVVELPSAFVSGRGDFGVVEPPPCRSSVADDPVSQSLKVLVMSVAYLVKVLVDRDRPVSGPAPVADKEVGNAACDSSSISIHSSQEGSVTNFIDDSDEESEAGSLRCLGLD